MGNSKLLSKEKLEGTINTLDCLSQEGFSEISSIAQLALLSLEMPDGHPCNRNIVNALKAIQRKAEDIQNCINFEAEQVGCNYVDITQHRYIDAQFQSRQTRMGA